MSSQVIENGPLEVQPADALWRYVSLPTLLLYLDRKLRLPSIRALRRLDRLEGIRPWDQITQADGFSREEYKQLFQYVRSRLSQREQELLKVNAGCSGENQRVIYNHWSKLIDATRYALCFFISRHESIAMWRLYAPNGFAIRTSLSSLNTALQKTGRKWRISQMKYWDKSNEITPDQTYSNQELKATLRRPFLLKSREYEYEREVRLFTVDCRERLNLLVDNVPPEDWIDQIRVSPEVWSEDAELLCNLIKGRCPALRGRFQSSPLASQPSSTEESWADIEADVLKDNARTKWPQFLWKP